VQFSCVLTSRVCVYIKMTCESEEKTEERGEEGKGVFGGGGDRILHVRLDRPPIKTMEPKQDCC